MPQQLPAHPNLDHLKKQAKDVLRVFRRQRPRWKLADAQQAIARGYGFVNWPSLKMHVEEIRRERPSILSASPGATRPDASRGEEKAPRRPEPRREDCLTHPIVGAWVADRVMSSMNSDPQPPNEDIVVEFQLSAEEIKLTQVATDSAGHEIAITTAMCADGDEHPVPFGEGVRIKALWTTSHMLEATLITSEQTTSTWSYEVSPDGKSLVLSTVKDRIVFKRL